MGYMRILVLFAITIVVVSEARFIQNPKERIPNKREVLLREFLAKRGKTPEEATKHRNVGVNKDNSHQAPHRRVPVFHPAAEPVQLRKPAPATKKHPLLKVAKKNKHKKLLTKQQEVCQTEECIATAQTLLDNMDSSVSPCEDFFQFTCGKWIENHPIPPTSSSISVFNDLRDNLSNRLKEILEAPKTAKDSSSLANAKNLFQSCMDLDTMDSIGVQPLIDVLANDLAGWPLTVGDAWDEASFNPAEDFADLTLKGGILALAQFYVFPDDFNTDQTILYMDQASLGLPRDFFLNPDLAVILNAYKDLMLGTAKVVRDAQGSAVTDEQLQTEVDDLIRFESAVAEIMTPDEDRLNYTALYNKMTVAELQGISGDTQLIEWKSVLNRLFTPAGVEITEDEQLVVYAPEYIEKFFSTFGNGAEPLRTIANYNAWRYVYAHAELTSKDMRDLFFQFDQVVAGITEQPERWLTCANLVNNIFGFAVSGPYVTQFFPPAAKDEMVELIDNLRAAYDEILDNLEWMDADTKDRAKTKLAAMREFIAYPDWVLDDAAVDAFYDGLTADAGTLFLNAYAWDGWSWLDMAKTLHQPTNRDLWITPPSIVNAFFYPSMNSITFPAGILQPPFFQSNRLQALNYGGIGMVIGHEMTHGFDNNGRQYDELGNLVNWWTEETGNAFVSKAQCFIDQYTGYAVPELNEIVPDAHLDGLQTLGENIADNGGMREAWNAYLRYKEANGPEPVLPGLEQYSPEQLFFINFGNLWCGHYTQAGLLNIVLNDEHSPGKYRVWGSCSNSPAFAEAFGCSAEDNMASGEDACQIW